MYVASIARQWHDNCKIYLSPCAGICVKHGDRERERVHKQRVEKTTMVRVMASEFGVSVV